MCECGCMMNNDAYRLPGGKGFFYLLELNAGCKNCTGGPLLILRKITRDSFDYDEAKEAPVLPLHRFEKGLVECRITCGLDPDAFRKVVTDQLDGLETGGRTKLDEGDAYEIADLLWDEAIYGTPEVQRIVPTPART